MTDSTPTTPNPGDEPVEDLDQDVAPDELDDDIEDFELWRTKQKAKRKRKRARIFGRVVTLPTSIPLGLSMDEAKLRRSSNEDDLKLIVGHLFGKDALEHWASQGADLEDFQVLLTYGYAHADGQDITFEEAAQIAAEARAEEEKREAGKARKKAKKTRGTPSSGTGR
jgi:hypothetical protein